jgi:anti-anti-sigma factor
MSFDVKLQISDGVALIRLSGELDARSAPRFNDVIIDAASRAPSELVVFADELIYMSSAGLRCLVFAHQKLPQGTRIVVVGARPDVAETIRLTGFDRSITLQEAGTDR